MICPVCHSANHDTAERCQCGFRLAVSEDELQGWFNEVRSRLERSYLAAETPWEQSGLSGSFEDWTRLRIPICECVEASGRFLDIGCANGFLLECLLDWTIRKEVAIEPYGLDYSRELVELARTETEGFPEQRLCGKCLGLGVSDQV